MKNFLIRTLSGAVYVTLIMFAVISYMWVAALIFSILAALTVYEFHKNTNKLENVNVNPIAPALASFMLLLIVAATHFFPKEHINIQPIVFVVIYFSFCLYFFISEIFKNKPNPINNIAYTVLGQIYVALPFLLLLFIKGAHERGIFLLAFFVFIWVNDTFAYLTGTTFGKHRMCERISPKKSWEGFAGGLIGALAVAVVFSYFETQLNMAQWFGFAIIVVIFGTLGDLLESLLKRTIGIKDSGTIMPGHGGLLDRFDSLLLAAPVVCIYLLFVSLQLCV